METTNANYVKGGSFLLQETEPSEIFTPEDFNEQHRMIAQTTSDFVDKEILPRVHEIDEQQEGLSVSLLKKAGEVGILSVDIPEEYGAVSYTHLRAHETRHDLVCRLLLEKKKK